MTTGLNTEDQDTSTSGKGFWGGASDSATESEDGANNSGGPEPDSRPADGPKSEPSTQPWLGEGEAESLLGPDEEGAVPAWLDLSHVVDAPAAAFPHVATDADSTAPLPVLPDKNVNVVVRAPQELDESERPAEPLAETEPAWTQEPEPVIESDYEPSLEPEPALEDESESRVPVEPAQESAYSRTAVPDLSWDESLSWDDKRDEAVHVPGEALEEPSTSSERSVPEGYVEVDMGYDAPSVFDGGDTNYLINVSAYDEADDWGGTGRNRLRIVVVVAFVVAALVAVYILGVRRFSNRFLPNTHVNGLDVAGLTVDEARDALEAETQAYSCDVKMDGFSVSVVGQDVALEREEQAMAEASLASQSAYSWPIALLLGPDVHVDDGLRFDEGALSGVVTTAVDDYNEQNLPADNAHIAYNEETGLYEVSGTTKGTAVDATRVVSVVMDDVRAFHRTSAPSVDSVTHKATVQDIPSYARTAEYANRSRTSDVDILVNGEPVITSEASQNAEWVSVGEGPEVVVDQDAVRMWAQYYVADAVAHSDDWSLYYLNEDAFVSEFCDRLAQGNTDGYEAPTIDELRTEGESREKAYAKGGWNSELGRYIDVDLDSQFARLFDENGEVIWESAFVSGEVYAGRSTVEGIFEIYSKETNTVLVGMDYDGDGAPDYESFVNYWMPFCGGYGLHDATWRSNFGGEYYYYYGSHGCVNLPYSKAEELYNITFVGEKVDVHW